MTRFVNTSQSTHHHGAERLEALMDGVQQVPEFPAKRAAALLLGSALAAAVAAVAYEVMDSAAESHLLMIWMVLWFGLFALLAFFAAALRTTGQQVKRRLDDWSRGIAEARADQRLWTIARQDARVMADLQAAMSRSEVPATAQAQAASATVASAPAETAPRSRSFSILRAYERHYF